MTSGSGRALWLCCGVVNGLAVFLAAAPVRATAPRQLVEITDFASPVVSPDGTLVAFRVMRASVERNSDAADWYVQRMNGTAPARRVGDGGVPLRDSAGVPQPAVPVWSPDGRWIYYRAMLEGGIDVWRASVDGAAAERVSEGDADVREFWLSADGDTLSYSTGPTRTEVAAMELREYDAGIRVDRTTPLGQGLFRSGYTEGRPATQRLGVMFNRVCLADALPDRWHRVQLATGVVRDGAAQDRPSAPLAPADLAVDVPDAWKLERDPATGRIAVLTRSAAATDAPRVVMGLLQDAKTRRWSPCTAQACSGTAISAAQWRPGTDEVVFTVTAYDDGFAQSLHRWNVVTGEVQPVASSSGMFAGEDRWGAGRCGVSTAALACVTADAGRPPRLERVDLQTGARTILFDPNAALAQDLADLPVELLRWQDAQGQWFTGQFHRARHTGGAPSPLFVTYYRCMGFLRGGSGDEWPLAAMAEQGIATLCINAPAFPADASERYGLGLSAVTSAVDLLASRGRIDRHRVGMGGISFGSEVTMWTLLHSRLLSAASLASPTTSPLYRLLGSNIGDPFLSLLRSNWQLGAPDETPAQWQAISPTGNLQKIHAPLLMQFAEQEYMHGLDYAIPLMQAHRADLYIFPDEPHNKFQPRHKLAVYQRNLDWFRFWLQGYEDADPRKAEQYQRWREMRAAKSQTNPAN
ncbi:Atxe2 family lasso peptide isopeptidase [Xanthomonas sp. CFBP 7698]|uniref:Atxe2 family lasso peptide isopeptidase n=1 Tax=Xanthomonas sp. CFBP 7698 TaxID=2082399 RepID=UPI000F4397A5|nr:Atxe2 family lasso peptide isopeptidase [Xanthomonas sp. CFBP 7698]